MVVMAVVVVVVMMMKMNTGNSRLSVGRLIGLQVNHGSSPLPPLTTMSSKEFARTCELNLVCHYYESSMLGCQCVMAKQVGGIVRH
jgi:hypothetical protein